MGLSLEENWDDAVEGIRAGVTHNDSSSTFVLVGMVASGAGFPS